MHAFVLFGIQFRDLDCDNDFEHKKILFVHGPMIHMALQSTVYQTFLCFFHGIALPLFASVVTLESEREGGLHMFKDS